MEDLGRLKDKGGFCHVPITGKTVSNLYLKYITDTDRQQKQVRVDVTFTTPSARVCPSPSMYLAP